MIAAEDRACLVTQLPAHLAHPGQLMTLTALDPIFEAIFTTRSRRSSGVLPCCRHCSHPPREQSLQGPGAAKHDRPSGAGLLRGNPYIGLGLRHLEGGQVLQHMPGLRLLEGVGVESPAADRGQERRLDQRRVIGFGRHGKFQEVKS